MILQVWSVWSDYEIMTTICMLTLLIYQHVKKFTLPLISPQKAHTITLSKSLRIGFLNCTIQPPFFHIIAMHCSKPFFRLLPWFIFFFFLSGDDAIVQSDAKGKHDTFLTLVWMNHLICCCSRVLLLLLCSYSYTEYFRVQSDKMHLLLDHMYVFPLSKKKDKP